MAIEIGEGSSGKLSDCTIDGYDVGIALEASAEWTIEGLKTNARRPVVVFDSAAPARSSNTLRASAASDTPPTFSGPPEQPNEGATMHQDKEFTDQEIVVDGNSYLRCTFSNCVIVYSGGTLPGFNTCTFRNGTRFGFDGAATRTCDLLRGFSTGGLEAVVAEVIKFIRGENPPPGPAAL